MANKDKDPMLTGTYSSSGEWLVGLYQGGAAHAASVLAAQLERIRIAKKGGKDFYVDPVTGGRISAKDMERLRRVLEYIKGKYRLNG